MTAAFLRRIVLLLAVCAACSVSCAQTPSETPPALTVEPAAPSPSAVPAAVPEAEHSPAGTSSPHTPQITWSNVRVNGPYIAMTFDDGPSGPLTPKLLDLLAERHIHVTFFVLGENVKAHPEIVKRAIAEGHEVGNHSWDHPNFFKLSDEAARSQLERAKEAIVAAIGKAPIYMRPPYGNLTISQRKWVHDDLGYKIILWSVDPLDWKRPGPDAVHRRIVEGTRNGSIILSHDIHPGTVEAMPATLDDLLGKGFKFVTISELLAMELPPEPAKPGTTKSAGAGGKKGSGPPKPMPTPGPPMPEKITGAPDAPQ